MSVFADSIKVSTQGFTDVVDISADLARCVRKSKLKNGTATLFVVGSTAGLTTIEYEPGLPKDLKIAYEKIAPEGGHYYHHERWGDDNGSSHVRATMMGPSLTVPFVDGTLQLGTWQQVVVVDFDTGPRKRHIVVQIMGE